MFFWKRRKRDPEKTIGNVTVGPSRKIRNSKDAKRQGIKGAEWVSGDDPCPLCKSLDGKTISVNHPDFDRFVPPLHDGCRCIRVYILQDEIGTRFNWRTPSKELVDKHMKS